MTSRKPEAGTSFEMPASGALFYFKGVYQLTIYKIIDAVEFGIVRV